MAMNRFEGSNECQNQFAHRVEGAAWSRALCLRHMCVCVCVCSQAEDRIGKLQGTTRDELEALVKCAYAAHKWVADPAVMGQSATAELQSAYAVLTSEGHSVPFAAKCNFCIKVSTELAYEKEWTQMAKLLSLSAPGPTTTWSASNPCFGALVPSKSASDTLESFWVAWRDAVLNEGLLESVKLASNAAGMAPLKDALKTLVAVLVQDAEAAPMYVAEGMQPALRLIRGLLALLVPTPMAWGSGPDDVNYVAPLDGGSTTRSARPIARDFLASGRTMTRYLENTIWQARQGGYTNTPHLNRFFHSIRVFRIVVCPATTRHAWVGTFLVRGRAPRRPLFAELFLLDTRVVCSFMS